MKKFLSLILVLGLSATLLAGCGGSSDTADSGDSGDAAEGNDAGYNTLNIIAAHGSTETVAQHTSYVYLKELLEERSGGAITMDIYPNQQLGGDREYTEACVQGNVTMGAPSPAAIAALCPSLNAFETPFLFSDYETARATMDSDAGKALLDSLEQYGLKGLGYYENGFRNLTCNKEINTLADLKGLKIRTMENNVHLAIWQALGANPTPADFSELYMSLEQGTLDAQENPYDLIVANKLYEPQAYVIETNHLLHTLNMVGSKATYDALPADIQQLVSECAAEAHQYARQMADERIEGQKSTIQDAGLEIITLEPAMIQEMADVSANVYDLVREQIGTDLVDSLLAQVETASVAE